jgi:hypothetical protein
MLYVVLFLIPVVLWQAWAIRQYRKAIEHMRLSIRCLQYRLGEGPMPDEVKVRMHDAGYE